MHGAGLLFFVVMLVLVLVILRHQWQWLRIDACHSNFRCWCCIFRAAGSASSTRHRGWMDGWMDGVEYKWLLLYGLWVLPKDPQPKQSFAARLAVPPFDA